MTRRRPLYFALAAITLLTGLAWRLAPLGLPPFLFKYGGSVLWAAMIYWLAALLSPKTPPLRLALISAAIACAVEFFKLVHIPAVEAFRATLPGKLILGRFFSLKDIAAYWLAIAAVARIDTLNLRPGIGV